MRQLKFRAWDLEKKEYVYNVFLDTNSSPYVFDLKERYANPFKPLENVKI